MKQEYNNLVRDNIPKIIEREGKQTHVRVLNEDEMLFCLENKLLEEANEYIEEKTVEELVDILEVIYAICKIKGISKEELERAREIKEIAHGAFNDRVYLEYVEDLFH